VVSPCHISLGNAASKRMNEDLRRFCGCGTTSPWRLRMRQMVATDGTSANCWRRWWAIVCGPLSRPAAPS